LRQINLQVATNKHDDDDDVSDSQSLTEVMYQQKFFQLFFFFKCRILDNMPIAWCYDTKNSDKKYCNPGFPIGCFVGEDGVAHDACVINVMFKISMIKKLSF